MQKLFIESSRRYSENWTLLKIYTKLLPCSDEPTKTQKLRNHNSTDFQMISNHFEKDKTGSSSAWTVCSLYALNIIISHHITIKGWLILVKSKSEPETVCLKTSATCITYVSATYSVPQPILWPFTTAVVSACSCRTPSVGGWRFFSKTIVRVTVNVSDAMKVTEIWCQQEAAWPTSCHKAG